MAKFGGAVGTAAPIIYDPTNSQPHGGVSSGINKGLGASDGDNSANQRIGGDAVNFRIETSGAADVAGPPVLAPAAGALTAGTASAAYSDTQLGASGGYTPYFFYVSAGSLPAGLSMNTANGDITGTLTAATGTSNFTVTVQDGEGDTDSKAYSIVVT